MEENLDLSKSIDINKALNEFKAKETNEVPQNSLISIDSEVPKMIRLVMKWFEIGQKQAEYLLLGFVIVMILFSLFLFFREGNNSVNGQLQLPTPFEEGIL